MTLSSPFGLLFKRSITADQSLDFCIPQILTVEDALPIATEDLRGSWGSLIHTEQVIVFRDTLCPRCCHFKTSTTRQRLHQCDPKRKIFARRGHGSTSRRQLWRRGTVDAAVARSAQSSSQARKLENLCRRPGSPAPHWGQRRLSERTAQREWPPRVPLEVLRERPHRRWPRSVFPARSSAGRSRNAPGTWGTTPCEARTRAACSG